MGRGSTLREGDHVLGRLRIEGWLGNSAALETGTGAWRLRHQPFKSCWSVEPDPTAAGAFAFSPGPWGRRPLALHSGVELRWRMRSFWKSTWAWLRRDDELIRFETRRSIRKAAVDVKWAHEIREWPELDGLSVSAGGCCSSAAAILHRTRFCLRTTIAALAASLIAATYPTILTDGARRLTLRSLPPCTRRPQPEP